MFTLFKRKRKLNENLSLSPLRARKSDSYSYRNSWKSEVTLGRKIKKRSKDMLPKTKQRRIRVITLQEAIENCPILLSQYWKDK